MAAIHRLNPALVKTLKKPGAPGTFFARWIRSRKRASRRAARGRSIDTPGKQAKPPAPPLFFRHLRTQVGQAFSLPDFCHGLLAASPTEAWQWRSGDAH